MARPETHPFLRDRCFGTDPARVAEAARATAEGFLAGGVLPVVKHMPGHGRAQVDSHLDLPVVEAPREDLQSDFAPFRALADLPLGMTAHIRYAALGGRPATQDRGVIDLIRQEIGFGGLLMTDDISMEALGGSIADRARGAVAAGCDVVLHCNGDRREMEECVEALGPLTGAGLERSGAALARRLPPEPADFSALEAELSDLTRGPVHG